jgi:cytochrome c oxidase subunit 4
MAQHGHDPRAHVPHAHVPHAHGPHAHGPHVVPLPIYLGVFAALMVGTAITVWAAHMDFGALNTPVALLIACSKATLVILFFMHVKYSERLVGLMLAVSILFLFILFMITLSDYWTRAALGVPGS